MYFKKLKFRQYLQGQAVVLQYKALQYLPSATQLPDSDDPPVDNEFQELIPAYLPLILALWWKNR